MLLKLGATAALNLSLTHDNAGSLTNITDDAATGRGAAFGYTPSGRLQYAVGPWGEYDYGYDGASNMDERDTVLAGTKTYSFPINDSGTGNQVTSVRDINWNATRTLTYQAGGDLYQDARSGGITYSYSYNARNRAVEIMKNNVEVGAYGYDAFEHRVWREVFSPSTVQTHYIYDLDGRLLAEQNGATGAVVKEYAWIDDMPLAVIDSSSGTPTTYYIHTGPVNEPLAMTNSAKAIVWNAYMEPFGAATVFGTASASIDMRLPGQSLEAETGNLNQNWFRNYDPSLGRYIEADPLGLEAGQNVYAYVDGDPLNFIDPEGLDPACAYYAAACNNTGGQSRYYCATAQVMCNAPLISPFLWGVPHSKISKIRQCLIQADKNAPKVQFFTPKGCFNAPTDQTINQYHQQCYKQCGVSPSRFPGVDPLGIPLGNGPR